MSGEASGAMGSLGEQLGGAARAAADRAAAGAASRLAGRAADARLVDVAYGGMDSPLGSLFVATTERGLVRLAFGADEGEGNLLAQLAAAVSARVLESPARTEALRRELDEYFAGRRRRFEMAIDWRLAGGFNRAVLRAAARIRYGETASYAEVARRAGSARAYRAAGNALHRNPVPIVVPCHRVLHSGGGLGGYGGGLEAKEFLLRLEGAI
jgi:methylated-DNA-[protein]-cysteine S-methyltransferase